MPASGISLAYRRRAQTLARIGRGLERAARNAERESAQEALRIARQLSSGPLTTAHLRRMGHPYAKRRPNPAIDAAIINVQTGRFRDAWRIIGPRKTSAGLRTRLVNDSPYAGFLASGTATMIERPIEARLRERVQRQRAQSLVRGIERALRTR